MEPYARPQRTMVNAPNGSNEESTEPKSGPKNLENGMMQRLYPAAKRCRVGRCSAVILIE